MLDLALKQKILTEVFGWKSIAGPIQFVKTVPKAETKIAIDLQTELEALFLEDKTNGVWAHVPNEGNFSKNKNFSAMHILRRMGKARGFPDYIFLWDGKCAAVELKYAKRKLSPPQETIKEWCDESNVLYRKYNNVPDVIEFLTEVGFLSK